MAGSGSLDGWIGVGLSEGLGLGGVNRVAIGVHDIALWRGADGKARAWHNRCPHRGMRLSYGFVRGDRLTCLYHGWTYDGGGGCVAIPAHPKLVPPRTIAVAAHACAEAAGMIWVAPGGAAEPLPEIEGRWTPVRSIRVEAGAPSLLRALGEERVPVAAALPHAFRVEPAELGRPLLCAVQPAGEGISMLHLSLAEGGEAGAAPRRAASDWARRLRREAEAIASAAA